MVQMIHRLIVTGSLLAAVLLASAAWAEGEDLANGEELFQICAPCHGTVGQGKEMVQAPSIAGLAQWYVEGQLTKFQSGARGAHPDDIEGLKMRPMSRALFTDKEKKDVSAWVANLQPVKAAATVEGDASKGQALYTPCIACHGPTGQGNQALSSPSITHLNDWYLVTSIHKFKDGLRGADASKDPTGAMMRTMAMTLASDEAVRDVVAYIRTLGN